MRNVPVGLHGSSLSDISSELHDYIIGQRTADLQPDEKLSFMFPLPTKETPVFFHSPFLLPDMEKATKILLDNIQSGKKILLYGDRDSDGVNSTAILFHFLRKYFPQANIHAITSTSSDAYGLAPEALAKVKKYKPDLLITLDFGTSNYDEIQSLHSQNINTIVIDHHEIPDKILPGCLVNPKREDSVYPDKKICTAFLALKLAVAILFRESPEYNKVYILREDEFGGNLFRNGIPWNPEDNFSLSEAETINPEELVGPDDLFLGNRIFYHQIRKVPGILEFQYLASALAGVGTITDMMPLTGENRSLVRLSCHSLSYLLQDKIEFTPGLTQLLKKLKLNPLKVTSKDMGWGIGPVLNAAGRMGNTELAFDLLLSEDIKTADLKSDELIQTNENRKERTKRNLHKVNLYFERHPQKTEQPVIFCYEPDMEPGVSGIVATRLVETYSRPAIFITPDHGKAKGSIRSFRQENVLDLLKTAEDILDQFGGHPEAGGFSVEIAKIPELQERLYKTSVDWLKNSILQPKPIQSDLVCNPEELKKELLVSLERLEPTGQGNPPILLSLKDVKPMNLNFLGDGKHARFKVMGAGSLKFLIWNEANRLSKYLSLNPTISLWGHLEENHFNGSTNLQFIISHFE